MTVLRSQTRGDMYIEVAVETPVNLNKRQQELLREFEKAGGINPKDLDPQSAGFFARSRNSGTSCATRACTWPWPRASGPALSASSDTTIGLA